MLRMIDEFDEELALLAALALNEVLEQRVHRRKYLGKIVFVPGKLGDALNLPKIISDLNSRSSKSRGRGAENFNELWCTLSEPTRNKVLDMVEWYDPNDMDWEDKRSNRKPIPPKNDAS